MRQGVEQFAAEEIAPRASKIDEDNLFPNVRFCDITTAITNTNTIAITITITFLFLKDLWKKMGEFGLLGVTAPEIYGGMGLGYLEHCLIMEELSRASASVALRYQSLHCHHLHLPHPHPLPIPISISIANSISISISIPVLIPSALQMPFCHIHGHRILIFISISNSIPISPSPSSVMVLIQTFASTNWFATRMTPKRLVTCRLSLVAISLVLLPCRNPMLVLTLYP